ncbi:MAG: hypothetical protein ACRDQ4_12340 [Pseudonocardiaceae bacterium]
MTTTHQHSLPQPVIHQRNSAGTRPLLCVRPPLSGVSDAAARHQVHEPRWRL